jgi:hypothetical protein
VKTRLEHHYDADVETVYALISDPGFIERKYVALGGRDVAVDRSETDGGCEVVTKRTMDIELPGFAKKVLTPSQTAIQTENWAAADASGVRVCTYQVEVQGVPSRVAGQHSLRAAAGGGTDHVIEIDAKVSIPLIGGRLEKLAADQGRDDIEAQFTYTDQELAQPR